ncbi:MAG: hypothetical protein ACYSW0_24560 [Planctomycetota bacterium]|jgi:hypothetical protein
MKWIERINVILTDLFILGGIVVFLAIPPGLAIWVIIERKPHWIISVALIVVGLLASLKMLTDILLEGRWTLG